MTRPFVLQVDRGCTGASGGVGGISCRSSGVTASLFGPPLGKSSVAAAVRMQDSEGVRVPSVPESGRTLVHKRPF